MALDQPIGFVDIEAVRGEKDRRHSAGGLHQLVDARPVRERRNDQGSVLLGRARHEVAEVVCDHEGHLPMGQDRGFGAPGRAGREEKPAGVVVIDGGIGHRRRCLRGDHRLDGGLAEGAVADAPSELQGVAGGRGRLRMSREAAMAQEGLGA
jgi:hypothetical protein